MQIYDTIVGCGQLIDIIFLSFPLAIGIAVFVWIAYMIRHAPGHLRHLERRFYE
jgi:hypothetical protein